MKQLRQILLAFAGLAIVVALPVHIAAQGSIFGTVSNIDSSTPDNPDIDFIGFIDNTDNEIRVRGMIGADYDTGNWFDDFQNYLGETPGIPYLYMFVNLANDETFTLAKTIPNNSFQQENIQLGSGTLVAIPDSVQVIAISDSVVEVSWAIEAGLRYHVFRRSIGSEGSMFRIDDPAGTLSSGLTNSIYIDLLPDVATAFEWAVVAFDASHRPSLLSEIVTATPQFCCVGTVGNINYDTGDAVDVSDLTLLVNHLFLTFEPLPCPAEANCNGDTGCAVDVSDLTKLINHLFLTFEAMPPCLPSCE